MEPIKITAPSVAEIVAAAQAKGMAASGSFPLEPDSKYVLALLRVPKESITEDVVAAIDADAAFLIGEHTTQETVVENKQIEAIVKVKIRLRKVIIDDPLQ